jgi:hypothetical protein
MSSTSTSKYETVKTHDPDSDRGGRSGKRKELGKMGREEEVAKNRTRCFILLGHGGTPISIGGNCPELYASKGPPGYFAFGDPSSTIENIIEISRPWKGKKGKRSSLIDHIKYLNENSADLGDYTPAYAPHDPFGEHTIWRATKTDMICSFSDIESVEGCTDCNDATLFYPLYQPYGIYDITNYKPPPMGVPPQGSGEAYFKSFQASREGAMNITDNVMDVCMERGMKDAFTDTDIPPRTDDDCSTVGSVSRSCTKCGIKHWRPNLLVSQIQTALESLYPNTRIHIYSNLCRSYTGEETPGTPTQHMVFPAPTAAVKFKGHAQLQSLRAAAAAGDGMAAYQIEMIEREIQKGVIVANLEDGISAIELTKGKKKKKRKKHTHKPKHKKKRGQARSRGRGRGRGRSRSRSRSRGRSHQRT